MIVHGAVYEKFTTETRQAPERVWDDQPLMLSFVKTRTH